MAFLSLNIFTEYSLTKIEYFYLSGTSLTGSQKQAERVSYNHVGICFCLSPAEYFWKRKPFVANGQETGFESLYTSAEINKSVRSPVLSLSNLENDVKTKELANRIYESQLMIAIFTSSSDDVNDNKGKKFITFEILAGRLDQKQMPFSKT